MQRLADWGRGYLGGWLHHAARRRGIRVFRYHGVVEKRTDPLLERNQHLLSEFAAHVRYARRRRVLGLDELLDALANERESRHSAVLFTFDDGFENNQAVAELMSRHRLPWCLFVPTQELGEDRAMWLDELSLLLLRGEAARVEALGAIWPLGDRTQRERAFRELRPRIKAMGAPVQRDLLAAIRGQFPSGEPQRLIAGFPSLRMLTWAQLGELAAGGVEIGSHGVHHEMHHRDQPPAERMRELAESRRELEARLGRPCRAFAFPNGDFVPESAQEVARAGYRAAFTTESGTVEPGASPCLLPRLAAPRSFGRFVRVYWWRERTAAPSVDVAPARV